MTSWLLLAEAGATAGSPEGGLFDLDATLPLMALQVVLLTFILNSLFFRPVGKAVEDREGYITTSRTQAKEKIAQTVRLEADLKEQLKGARLEAQKVILEAEQDSDRLYREAMAVAQAEAIASRESARSKIDGQRADALSLLEADADRLADLIVDRLLPAS
ncbi:F0F1 ATP synthase subunit B' [Cyanobium sp. AMD-g]|jgi:F-type H+-transporting ATPase subunit b|uniref:F0F1 ATP synthase subunit B' n=1 Tax=Synechococcales TaxID=1890424 RepID=UPI001C22CFA2|nr:MULTISPECIES: F0F1 ATP synthase subunit B' [Synechococcales]MCP9900448.1 F0F1 ATP synthase subunit B' [Cyanobium sp. Cruz CV11-17]MCP9919611.1 F0F1 ATP synthase subunit B' [Cyanobium sp. Cruz CV13-4-11]MCP9930215.1 F0F1 ATP synthase subunit B' [Cyanobium sp. AMD-g]